MMAMLLSALPVSELHSVTYTSLTPSHLGVLAVGLTLGYIAGICRFSYPDRWKRLFP
jgi:hypothetical protein